MTGYISRRFICPRADK